MQNRLENRARRFAAKGQHAGRHFVEDRTEGKEVGARVDRLAAHLLGRHVGDGTDGGAGAGELLFGHGGRGVVTRHCGASDAAAFRGLLRQAEIENLCVVVGGDENIGRLDIAMDDALGVRRFEPFGDFDAQIEQQIERERLPTDPVLERLAFEALHRQERLAFVFADFVDRADIGMVERRSGLRFALEAFESAPVAGHVFGEELQGDETVQAGVFGFVDHTHSTPAEPLDNAVVGNRLPYQ